MFEGEEVLPHRAGVVSRHGDQDKQGFMVAFFKSLEPLSRKIAEIQRPLNLKTRSKRSAKRYEEYWDAPNSKLEQSNGSGMVITYQKN